MQFYKIKINFFDFKGYYFKVLYFWNPNFSEYEEITYSCDSRSCFYAVLRARQGKTKRIHNSCGHRSIDVWPDETKYQDTP